MTGMRYMTGFAPRVGAPRGAQLAGARKKNLAAFASYHAIM
jgi:hypothetical protein